MISANHAATSASDAGDHGDGETSPELLGTALQGTVLLGVCGYSELEDSRIQWWWRQQLRWSESTAATKSAAAEVRVRSGSALLLTNEGAEALEGLYGSRQAQRVHARDQMVTGVLPESSSRGGGFRP